jgi:predicted nucleic acid-binding protein
MSAVFLDTVGLLALWDADDQWHEAATRAFDAIRRDRAQIVTTTLVFFECGNAAARRPYRGEVDHFRQRLATRGELVVPTESECEQAWSAYARGEADRAGIVDHVSFVVMRRLGLTDGFTNDRHFRAAGFRTLF